MRSNGMVSNTLLSQIFRHRFIDIFSSIVGMKDVDTFAELRLNPSD